jgi:hypothetical protein
MGEAGHKHKFWWGDFLENSHLEDKKAGGRIIFKIDLRDKILIMGGGWNWPMIVSNGFCTCSVEPSDSTTIDFECT